MSILFNLQRAQCINICSVRQVAVQTGDTRDKIMIFIVIIVSPKLTHVLHVIKFTLKYDYHKCDFLLTLSQCISNLQMTPVRSNYVIYLLSRADIYPAPGRVALISLFVCLYLCIFVSLFLCQQDYEKTAGPICMKFSGKVWSDHGTT